MGLYNRTQHAVGDHHKVFPGQAGPLQLVNGHHQFQGLSAAGVVGKQGIAAGKQNSCHGVLLMGVQLNRGIQIGQRQKGAVIGAVGIADKGLVIQLLQPLPAACICMYPLIPLVQNLLLLLLSGQAGDGIHNPLVPTIVVGDGFIDLRNLGVHGILDDFDGAALCGAINHIVPHRGAQLPGTFHLPAAQLFAVVYIGCLIRPQ